MLLKFGLSPVSAGVGTTDQLLPFQCSATVTGETPSEATPVPAAQTSLLASADTSASLAFFGGTAMRCHDLPFQCAMIAPTAQASVGESAAAPARKPFSVRRAGGVSIVNTGGGAAFTPPAPTSERAKTSAHRPVF